MIYFAQSRFGGPIKIGLSQTPETRLKALHTSSAEPLVLLATRDGNRRDEAELHERFSPWRLNGEWHETSSSLLIHIICCDRVAPLVKHPVDLAYRLPPMIQVRTTLHDGAKCYAWQWTARCTFFEAECYLGRLRDMGRKETETYKALVDLWRLAQDDALETDEVLIGPYLERKGREKLCCPEAVAA